MEEEITPIVDSSPILSDNEARTHARVLANLQNELLELSANLEKVVLVPFGFQFRRKKDITTFFLYTSLISDVKDSILLMHRNKSDSIDPEIHVKDGWSLSLNIFSDEELRESYVKFSEKKPKEAGYTQTSYYLDTEGNWEKVLMVHKDFRTTREEFQKDTSNLVKFYLSKLTQLDYVYIKRALNLFLSGIEGYLELSPTVRK